MVTICSHCVRVLCALPGAATVVANGGTVDLQFSGNLFANNTLNCVGTALLFLLHGSACCGVHFVPLPCVSTGAPTATVQCGTYDDEHGITSSLCMNSSVLIANDVFDGNPSVALSVVLTAVATSVLVQNSTFTGNYGTCCVPWLVFHGAAAEPRPQHARARPPTGGLQLSTEYEANVTAAADFTALTVIVDNCSVLHNGYAPQNEFNENCAYLVCVAPLPV